jgi:signal peptidase I
MEDSRYTRLIDHVILEQLGKGKTFTFTLTGNSMHPLIRKGDRVHIQGCDPRDLSAGDIITYRNDALYVTHRVLWIRRRGTDIRLIAKGDSEITVDPPLSPEHILGKVAAIGRANRVLHLEAPHWRLLNHFLWMLSLGEATLILFYRLAVAKLHPSKPCPAKGDPTHLSR